jgi:hypothetical protein
VGYSKTYYIDLFYADTGEPYDLTGVTQLIVSHPGSSGSPVEEVLNSTVVVTTTGTTVNTSNQLTAIASMTGIAVGQLITGTGIPSSTFVTAINVAASSLTMSQNATASGSPSVIFATAPNVTVVGAPGAGKIQVVAPAWDTALMQVNPNTQQNQDLQISVTNADGSLSGFLLQAVLNIVAPTYGVV